MNKDLINKQKRGVLLGRSSQIEIFRLLDKGKTYEEIDNILKVRKGSSRYTIEFARKEFSA